MRKAYWVARAKILDPVKYKRYTEIGRAHV